MTSRAFYRNNDFIKTSLTSLVCLFIRFPHLFSQYPFPILINSGMMKLAELFKQGSNFLKICVLRVFQQSSLHLDKVKSSN